MFRIPKPSDEIVEKFNKIIKSAEDQKHKNLLMSADHCSALIIKEIDFDHFDGILEHDERFYAGFWRFDERWIRRKHHLEENIGIMVGQRVFTYKAMRLANILKVAGKKVHLYICRRKKHDDENLGFLLVLSDKCGIALAPVEGIDEYEDITRVARLIGTNDPAKEKPSDTFLNNLPEEDALKLIEKLSRELGILHM